MPASRGTERRSKRRSTLLSDRVVARFLTGSAVAGNLILFDPASGILKIRAGSEKRELKCSALKAIFFLRRPNQAPYSETLLKPVGKKVRVSFADGEEITGYSYGLHPLEKGFYLYPVHRGDRNERIYVVTKNAVRIRTEK